jgi:diguanylate cyclase (GGDEF)-like protein
LGLQRLTSKYINDHDSVYSISRHSNGELIFICNNKVIHKNRTGQERILLETEHMIAGWTARWDGEDRIWVGSSNGLYEIGVKAGVVLRQFKSLPGGSIWEFNFSESLRVGSQGEIFCGLRENFTLLDSKQLRAIRNKPVLALRKHTWVNADSFLVSEQHVNAGKWSLDFSFACNWAMDEENLLFRYRLVGFDETWSKLQKVENLHFTSLPIGEYSLLVQAYSPLFGWGDSAELFAFKVSPATRLDSLLTRTLGPVFKLKESAKGFWKNMGLQKMEDRVDALVQSKVSEVEQDKQELLRENRELSKFSNVDTLTGAANRRAFDDFLEQSIQQSMRHQLQLSLILLDIDYFKGYNDAYGHLAGDDALKKVSVIVQGLMRRAGDLFARYGGEEFAIVLPLTDTDSAQALAKRINKAIWSAMIEHLGQPKNKRLTCSMGVVSINFAESREAEARDLIHEADSNLYTAKHKGKNCFIASEVVF